MSLDVDVYGIIAKSDISRREIVTRPPTKFVVEVIGIEKIDGDYCHGIRVRRSAEDISPTQTFDSSFDSESLSDFSSRYSRYSSSIESSSYLEEYNIWRSWDECLIFQNLLEQRYSDMAQKKRAALRTLSSAHEKAYKSLSKSNKESGIYNTRLQRAASFASLPSGPDPRLIAKDIHHFIPKLTIKGSVFGTNPAVVAKRIDQLTLFFDPLWGKDVVEEELPKLVLELKEDTDIRDFFAYMAHDHKVAKKYHNLHIGHSRKGVSSITSSIDADRRSISSISTTSSSDDSSDSGTSRARSSLSSTWKRLRGKVQNVAEDGSKTSRNHGSIIDQRSRMTSSKKMNVQDAIPEEIGESESELEVETTIQEVDTPQQTSFTLYDDKSLPPTPRQIHRQSDASAEIYDYADYHWNDEDMYQAGHLQRRDSVMTFRSFMTSDSANAIVGSINEDNYIEKEAKSNAQRTRSHSIESKSGLIAGRHIFTLSSLSVDTLSEQDIAQIQDHRLSNMSMLSDDIDAAIRCWENESDDEEAYADNTIEFMDDFTFAPLDSPMRFPDSRPVSIFSVISENISPPPTPTVSTFPNIF